ncbi:tetratricopeptide repeat protein [Clostridium sp. C105KSO13]|uniref:tetratricopeptide repeat protein n=1 Tax=Clostridium sp. C105KSO13 TaxID=1776045 RepID=UPI0007405960|nr:tetratricopeptide repeat protein [Clostridium sp. C105KSO13]CUX45182.1 lipoprotein NlpI [Clostridium sp. C105KSO13]
MKKLLVCAILTAFLLTGCQNAIKEGTGQLKEGKYEEAVSTFKKAADEKKDTAEAYRGLGMAYYEQQDYQSAKDAFLQVIDNGGESTPVLYNLIGVCSIHLEDYQGALDAFSKGIHLTEKNGGRGTKEQDYADTVREMKFNEIVCYEKLLDWENAKKKAVEYVGDYPKDKDAQKEAVFLNTR